MSPDESPSAGTPAPQAADFSALAGHDVVVVLTNAPDMLLAKRIAHILVEEQLAACVNLGQSGLSMYMWQGALEGADEVPITIKTTGAQVPRMVERLLGLHPYEVPEVLVLPVVGGTRSYLDWVRAQAPGPQA
ncbi:divalent-cation tolerance protein CutA [Parapusillimonas granuli]|uniref:Divalent-cation tolerance protein CutA n=1 Tax=Parapusillimonas granuli TaxID=380911 RepID=A0A853FUV7_9BURK|nr:divalent-cation tolerance protein CutA [Parapusillimonas granuli]MBB5216280.1 periplasmic divalent cation tolerance protein [Parapusillimonas granuli]NYT47957.1 divalent-cation tolerance protein CutA [Parapusillimonas granuli]